METKTFNPLEKAFSGLSKPSVLSAIASISNNPTSLKKMTHEPTKWMKMQTNSLQTPEDRLDWTIERLNWIKNIASGSRGEETLNTVLDEVDTLLSELQSGEMIDRGIVD